MLCLNGSVTLGNILHWCETPTLPNYNCYLAQKPMRGKNCPTINKNVKRKIFRIVSSLNLIQLPLFMINKVNATLLRQFLGFYCLYKRTIWLNHDVILISLLFRIVSSLNHIHLPLLMISKVNVTLFRQFLGFYCLSKFIVNMVKSRFFLNI